MCCLVEASPPFSKLTQGHALQTWTAAWATAYRKFSVKMRTYGSIGSTAFLLAPESRLSQRQVTTSELWVAQIDLWLYKMYLFKNTIHKKYIYICAISHIKEYLVLTQSRDSQFLLSPELDESRTNSSLCLHQTLPYSRPQLAPLLETQEPCRHSFRHRQDNG